MKENEFYTVSEAAKALKVSPSTVWRWIQQSTVYQDLGADFYARRNQEAIMRHHVRQLEAAGYQASLTKAA